MGKNSTVEDLRKQISLEEYEAWKREPATKRYQRLAKQIQDPKLKEDFATLAEESARIESEFLANNPTLEPNADIQLLNREAALAKGPPLSVKSKATIRKFTEVATYALNQLTKKGYYPTLIILAVVTALNIIWLVQRTGFVGTGFFYLVLGIVSAAVVGIREDYGFRLKPMLKALALSATLILYSNFGWVPVGITINTHSIGKVIQGDKTVRLINPGPGIWFIKSVRPWERINWITVSPDNIGTREAVNFRFVQSGLTYEVNILYKTEIDLEYFSKEIKTSQQALTLNSSHKASNQQLFNKILEDWKLKERSSGDLEGLAKSLKTGLETNRNSLFKNAEVTVSINFGTTVTM